MAKSEKNLVRDILRAQGIWDQEPTEEAVKTLRAILHEKWKSGYDDGEYDTNQARDA